MATDPGAAQPAATPPTVGDIKRYPVSQPDGATRTQLILVTSVDADGNTRGFPVGYEDQAAQFPPGILE